MRGSAGWRRVRLGNSAAAREGGFAGPASPPLDFGAAVAFGGAVDGVAADRAEGESGLAGLAIPPIAFGQGSVFGAPIGVGMAGAFGAPDGDADGAAKGGGIGAVATGSSAARAILATLSIDSSMTIAKSLIGHLAMRDFPCRTARARPCRGPIHYSGRPGEKSPACRCARLRRLPQ